MSAIVCGKRSFFEELPSSPSVSKRVRYSSSSSPARASPPRSAPTSFVPVSSLLHQLLVRFPDMDEEVLERALEQSGDDLDLAIKSLHDLRLGCPGNNTLVNAALLSNIPPQANDHPEVTSSKQEVSVEVPLVTGSNWPTDGAEWVELFVREITSATNLDDTRGRAARALEALEKSICARAEASNNFQQENAMLKEQVHLLHQENTILKRAVSIQHERQKEFDHKAQELQQLKQLVGQYQEQVRTLEVNNYALAMHLKQAQQGSSFPGRYNPDVF